MQNRVSKHAKDVSLKLQSASLFVNTCNNVRIINVDLIDSNGTGIVFYNPSGVVHLDMCNFINNSFSVEQPAIGGGGLVIEANDVTAKYNCTVVNSNFVNNTAKSRCISILSQATNPSEYFGRGGGISVVFRGGTANNTLQLIGVKLENNTAQFGGGLFLAFFDSTNGNNVTIEGIEVTKNIAMIEVGILLPPFASGGGISINFAASEVEYPFDNAVEINHGEFISNTAQLGGGLAVDVVYDAYGCVNAGNKFLIENCNFENNEGYQGSSAYFMGTTKQTLLKTTLSFINFTDGHCTHGIINVLPCLGSVFLSHFPLVTIQNSLLFSGNAHSALSLTASSIELLPSTQLQFINNSAINGAALHIVDCSSVIVNDNTSLFFRNNIASNYGGAIYSEACTQITRYCFIRHSNSILDPDQWKINVSFSENQANSHANSIFMDSIQSCVWSKYNKNITFCWKGWSFLSSDSCLDQLRSSPAYITNNGPAKYTVYPGECINLDFTVFDDLGNNITDQTILQVIVLSGAALAISYYEPNCKCYTAPRGCWPESRICEPGEIAIESDCINSPNSHILIHPPNQTHGIVLDLSLKTCDKGTSCGGNSQYPGICSINSDQIQDCIESMKIVVRMTVCLICQCK